MSQDISKDLEVKYPVLLEQLEEIRKSSKAPNILICGGFLRDFYFKKKFDDVDCVTDCNDFSLLYNHVNSLDFCKVDKPHFIKKHGMSIEMIRIEIENVKVEITQLKPLIDSTIENIIEEDAKDRDFTINCCFYDISKKVLIDPFKAERDFHDKILRCVKDPYLVFDADCSRILRALRFKEENEMNFDGKLQEYFNSKSFMIAVNRNNINARFPREFSRIISSIRFFDIMDLFFKLKIHHMIDEEMDNNMISTILQSIKRISLIEETIPEFVFFREKIFTIAIMLAYGEVTDGLRNWLMCLPRKFSIFFFDRNCQIILKWANHNVIDIAKIQRNEPIFGKSELDFSADDLFRIFICLLTAEDSVDSLRHFIQENRKRISSLFAIFPESKQIYHFEITLHKLGHMTSEAELTKYLKAERIPFASDFWIDTNDVIRVIEKALLFINKRSPRVSEIIKSELRAMIKLKLFENESTMNEIWNKFWELLEMNKDKFHYFDESLSRRNHPFKLAHECTQQ